MKITEPKRTESFLFGEGTLAFAFEGVCIENGKVEASWSINRFGKQFEVGVTVTEPPTKVAKFKMNRKELEELATQLCSMHNVVKESTGSFIVEHNDARVEFIYLKDSQLSVAITQSVIDQCIVAIAMVEQQRKEINRMQRALEFANKRVNELTNELEYAKLEAGDEDSYDKALADLVTYRSIFPPDTYTFDALRLLATVPVQARQMAVTMDAIKNILGEKD